MARMDEPVVTYTMRDVIDQINTKLDMLTTTFGGRMSDMELRVAALEHEAPPIRDGELRMTHVESRVERQDTRLSAVEKVQDQAVGAAVFKDKAFAKLVGLASLMGMVAGTTVGLINALT